MSDVRKAVREALKEYSRNKWPINPEYAVRLYEAAEWRLPESLKQTKAFMDAESERVMQAWRSVRYAG